MLAELKGEDEEEEAVRLGGGRRTTYFSMALRLQPTCMLLLTNHVRPHTCLPSAGAAGNEGQV